MQPNQADLGMVGDLVDAAVLRLKLALVKRCGGDVPVRPERPAIRRLSDVLQPTDDLALGAAATFRLANRSIRGLVILDVPLVQRLVGLFLGENPGNDSSPVRKLTRLDLQMAGWVCQDLVGAFVKSSSMPGLGSSEISLVQANARSLPGLPSSPSVVEIEFELGPEDAPFGRATIAFSPKATGVLWPERSQAPKRPRPPRRVERVQHIEVPVVAEVARRRYSMAQLKALRPGDVIELGSLSSVQLRVGGRRALAGEAGEQAGVRCVRITDRPGAQGAQGRDR